jgi:DtxR family Mn-dependent transcriptional regulator
MITKLSEKAKRPKLSPSLEDYLEAIYWLAREHGVARVSHIAERIKVNKSSVTGALKLLAAKGYIEYDPYQFIQLSPSGEQLAKDIVRRHAVLKRFFVEILGVDEVLAGETACRMEHHLDPRVLKKLLEFVESSTSAPPRVGKSEVK